MDFQAIGRVLLVFGLAVALVGGLLVLFGNTPFFRSIGNLPGDIRIEGRGFTCLIPIVSMILLSVVLSVILNIIIRFINRP